VARVVVDVMLKPEILDAQGQAIQRALGRLGFDGVQSVRQGKRFEIELDADLDDPGLAQVKEMAERLLANTVIEDFEVRSLP
jgi:phosphoribosylformylglycinamidine synthase PurS subunit